MAFLTTLREKFAQAAEVTGKVVSYCREKSDSFMIGGVMTGYVGTCSAAGTYYGIENALQSGATPLTTMFLGAVGGVVTSALAYGGCKFSEWRAGESVMAPGVNRSILIGAVSGATYAAGAAINLI